MTNYIKLFPNKKLALSINNLIQDYNILFVFLRGSSQNEYEHANDIDLLIITDDLKKFSHSMRRKILEQYFYNLDKPVDIICTTLSEFMKYRNREILRKEKMTLIYRGYNDVK